MSRARSAATMAEWCRGSCGRICYAGRTRCVACERSRVDRVLLVLVAVLLPLVLLFARAAQGQSPDALHVARACWVEANFRTDDCAAIAHVLMRRAERANVSLANMIDAYSALDADTDRAAFARKLPDGDAPEWSAKDNARWAKLRAHAAAVLAGEVPDPCRADHWGAKDLPRDVERAQRAIDAGRWRLARCSKRLANNFYAERAR